MVLNSRSASGIGDEPHVPRPATLLVIDGDPSTARVIGAAIRGKVHRIEAVSTGADAHACIGTLRPDLVILELLLPDADGLLLCASLSRQWPAPILVLSNSSRMSDRVLSLQLGAADFVAKPFNRGDLGARIDALLRRGPHGDGLPVRREASPSTGRTLTEDSVAACEEPISAENQAEITRFGSLTIDVRRRAITIKGIRLPLTRTENLVLAALASDSGRVWSRGELTDALWEEGVTGQWRSIDVHIRRIRAKLAQFGDVAPCIVTVRGFGYRLETAGPSGTR
jgi:DNA-binding response OmpR family regulator